MSSVAEQAFLLLGHPDAATTQSPNEYESLTIAEWNKMSGCAHTSWLCVDGTTLLDFGRLQTLLGPDILPDPMNQTPSLVVLIGESTMSDALQMCTSRSTPRPSSSSDVADIHLHLLPSSTCAQSPILLADCGRLLSNPAVGSGVSTKPICHEVRQRPLPWLRNADGSLMHRTVTEQLFQQLIVPFADVICVFGDDLGGGQGLARWLAYLMDIPHIPQRHRFREQQMLVILNDEHGFHRMAYSEGLCEPWITSLEVLQTMGRDGDPSPMEMALQKIHDIQILRARSRWLFTANELIQHHGYACDHFARTNMEPYDFLLSARLAIPIPPAFPVFAAMLLSHLASAPSAGVHILASCIVLDSLLHIFHPFDVYDALYHNHCCDAVRRVFPRQSIQRSLLSRLRLMVRDLTFRQQLRRAHPVASHREILKLHRGRFLHIRSTEVCLICIMRRPVRVLSCGHAICEVCIRTFGELVPGEPCIYAHPQCALCYTSIKPPNIQIRPPSALPRVLCVDANGPNMWDTLNLLETSISQLMGFPFPIQECFDIVFGRGPGVGPVRSLFLHELAIKQCQTESQSSSSGRSIKALWLARTRVRGQRRQPIYLDCYSAPGPVVTIAAITSSARPEPLGGCLFSRLLGRFLTGYRGLSAASGGPERPSSTHSATEYMLNVLLPSSHGVGYVREPSIMGLSTASVDAVARALVASHFYFELAKPPQFADSRYRCSGYVLCRLRVTDQFWFLRALTLSSHRLYIGSVGYTFRMLTRGQPFRKLLTFTVTGAEQPISIRLGNPFSASTAYCISGSPFTIASLSQIQFT
ncbi:unnamed protein product [Tuber aestivum]|uniref:RING-type domain-containing protein n=1 Tax=Tuber aestivum TaxID=59557 RepID=A0A292PID3_9PEZI|nr:unnamed protein product [Tuber aestivum]